MKKSKRETPPYSVSLRKGARWANVSIVDETADIIATRGMGPGSLRHLAEQCTKAAYDLEQTEYWQSEAPEPFGDDDDADKPF